MVVSDTAGYDVGRFRNLRVEKTYNVLRKTDLAIVVLVPRMELDDDRDFIKSVRRNPTIVVINKSDKSDISEEQLNIYKRNWVFRFVKSVQKIT